MHAVLRQADRSKAVSPEAGYHISLLLNPIHGCMLFIKPALIYVARTECNRQIGSAGTQTVEGNK
jgi:hypothetical protein